MTADAYAVRSMAFDLGRLRAAFAFEGAPVSSFTKRLTLTHLDADWRRWELRRPLVYEVGAEGSGRRIVVPRGFQTDGASIPRPLWALLPAWGRYSRAAVVHDHLYACLRQGTPHQEAPTRRAADAVFLEAMRVCGVSRPIAWLMWAAVRLFGRSAAAPITPTDSNRAALEAAATFQEASNV